MTLTPGLILIWSGLFCSPVRHALTGADWSLGEVVICADETAPVGICFMPVTDNKTVKNRLHL